MQFGRRHGALSLPVFRARLHGAQIAVFCALAMITNVSPTSANQPEPTNLFRLFQKPAVKYDTTPHPAVVRIIVNEGNTLANGSGSFVAQRESHGVVVTNWHVVREAAGKIEVIFPDGFRSAATILKTDKDWDLAALLIWRPKVSPIAISARAPQPGEPLSIAGYGQGDYRSAKGICTQYVAPSPKHPYEIVELSAEARQGDSGGPIFNEQGELAGVLFGASRNSTSGSYCARVRTFLSDAWPDLESRPDSSPASVSAPFVAYTAPAPTPDPESDIQTPQTPMVPVESPISTTPPQEFFEPEEYPKEPVRVANIPPPARPTSPATPWNIDELIGDTNIDRAKAVLALIGLLAVWGHLARWIAK